MIDPDKKSVGTVPSVPTAYEAVANGTAATFAVELRSGIVCADVDLDDAAGVAAKDDLVAWLTANGWAHVVATSGQPGHFHVYARLRYGNDRQWTRAKRKALAMFTAACKQAGITSQVRTRNALVRPITAPHPTLPTVATLLDPATPFEATLRLGLVGAPTRDAVKTKPKSRPTSKSNASKKGRRTASQNATTGPSRLLSALDPAFRVLALYGAGRDDLRHPDGHLDGSKAISALAWHAAWQDLAVDQWLDIALNPAHLGCQKAQDRDDDGRYARDSYARAQQAVAVARATWHGRPADPHLEAHLTHFTQDVEAVAWSAQSRPAVLAVTAFFNHTARLAGTATGIGASQRQIADGTGMERDRVKDTLRAMRAAGVLAVTREYGDDGVAAHEWRLTAKPRVVGGAPVSGGNCNHSATVGHPAFTAKGLDKAGWLTYRTLTDQPLTTAEVVVATTHLTDPGEVTRQRSRTTVARLRALAEVGLAAQDENGAWVRGHGIDATQDALDAAARHLGVEDEVARLKAKHATERATFAARDTRLVPEHAVITAREDAPTVDWAAWEAQQAAWRADQPYTPVAEPAPTPEDAAFAQSVFAPGMTHGEARRMAMTLPGDWDVAPNSDGSWTLVQMLVDPESGEVYDREIEQAAPALRLVA